MNTDAIKRFLTALSSTVEIKRGQLYQLIQSAETSYHLRDIDSQHEIGLLLQSFGYPFNQVGKFYESIYLFRSGQYDKARKLLECVANSAPSRYRSKALLSLSAAEERIGRFEESLRLRLQITSVDDPVILLEAQRGIAALRSIEGDHRAALRDLERLMPLAHIIGRHGHPQYFAFLNSYATELSESGRMEEALQAMNVIAATSFIDRFPECQDTLSEIKAKRRRSSFVAVTAPEGYDFRDPRIQLLITFMKENLHQSISLEDLSAIANISQAHLCREFKVRTGFPPIEYLIRLRMEKAHELLRNSSLNIKEVMALVGCNTRSNFKKHFKRYFDCSPSEYRKRFRPRRR